MKHNIIKTENYLLVVDDSEIKYDDHFIDEYKMLYMLKNESTEKYKSVKKVISHLPLNNSPILEGVPLLPPLEDEVERLVKEHWEKDKELNNPSSFKSGYNKAKEKYNADLGELLSDFYLFATNGEVCDHEVINEFIQSLQQPEMPVAFECEESVDSDSMYVDYVIYKPKTTTNPQYQTKWVGNYIY
jgi:hypothetical protein